MSEAYYCSPCKTINNIPYCDVCKFILNNDSKVPIDFVSSEIEKRLYRQRKAAQYPERRGRPPLGPFTYINPFQINKSPNK